MRFHPAILPLVLAVTTGADRGIAFDGARMFRCQQRIAAAADVFLTRRRALLGRCLAKAWRCPAALGGRGTVAEDRCLATISVRCRARLYSLRRAERGLASAVGGCTEPRPIGLGLSTEALLDIDDGLGFGAIAAFCPSLPDEPSTPAAASVCQRLALACVNDAAFAASVPRAADVIERLGLTSALGEGCLGPTACGNGTVEDDEECDDGPANSDVVPDACRSTCREPACGDGVVDGDEDCDDGNLADGDACTSDCTFPEGACGDGLLDDDEECDDGNVLDGDSCRGDCTLPEGACGNGVVEDDEECDGGRQNSDLLADRCRTDCSAPWCGDGVVDPRAGEECEPPETILCDPDCAFRLPWPLSGPLPLRRGPIADGLARCQEGIRRGGSRAFARAVVRLGRCVVGLEQCMFERSEPEPCMRRVARRCEGVLAARDALRRDAVLHAAAACRSGASAPSIAQLLDPAAGLGFAAMAASCPLAGPGAPRLEDLLDCVYRDVQCRAENAVARTAPRAYEALEQAGLEPDDDFPCVTDPEAY